MRLTCVSLTLLLIVSGIDEIFAQFKVIKMEEMRSLTHGKPVHGKGKLLRNSNVTVIHIMPSERINRRIDKRRRTAASDLEVVTVTPLTKEEASTNLLKLHILNVRTGKIQDAIIRTNDNHETITFRQKPAVTSSNDFNDKIIRIKPHRPETKLNEIALANKFPLKPYKLKNKFMSSKCRCEDNAKMWNCRKIQISIARCRTDQFLCCSGF
ncbi:CLUMA_CG005487, isoform A [Clunio marinus]|uniref:CLUMA_CG005487, isoform A n=1 Tax=Clunio marinus TaxID=568069 RepID=A0A1J1HWE9_9DIPT|nr:CLUMA_CG005487, isoform A [Clunio marinus]